MNAIQKIGLINITDPELLSSLVVTLKYSGWYQQTVIDALVQTGECAIREVDPVDWSFQSLR
jgi:hypothetical protein